jgi:hypothetical protein
VAWFNVLADESSRTVVVLPARSVTIAKDPAPPGRLDVLTNGVQSLLHRRLEWPMSHLIIDGVSRRKEEQPAPRRRLEAVQHLLWVEARDATRGHEVFG